MTADRWFESKKGYTLVHTSGERYTVFWTGDKDGPWRVVCRGVYSENFKTVFDSMTYVDQKTGTVSERGNAKDLDPAKREAFREHDEAMDRMKAEQEMERMRKQQQDQGGRPRGRSYFEEAADAMRAQAEAARDHNFFRKQFENQWKVPPDHMQAMEKMLDEMRRKNAQKAAEQAEQQARERAKKQEEDFFGSGGNGADFESFFEKMFKNHGGPWAQGGPRANNHTNTNKQGRYEERNDQAGPARSSSGKRAWHIVLELPGSGPWKEDDVKKQFRKLAMAFHPDRPGGDTAKMAELNTAWDQACAALGIK